MDTHKPEAKPPEAAEIERLAEEKPPGLIAEFWQFLRSEGKWWLIPILIALLVPGILAFLSTTGLAPFIYPVF
jgi:hypothetical protein